MTQRKSTNGQAGARGGAKGARGRKNSSGRTPSPLRGTARGDILGVVLAVVSIAMLVALVMPSSAFVTKAVHDVLALAFGAGAFLVPVSLFLFAVTFFVEDGPLNARVATGAAIVAVSVLAMLSLNLPTAEALPPSVFSPATAQVAGGYVGGAIAYALLLLVGRVVGNVVLAGVVLAGVVVCGFSISGALARARDAATRAQGEHRERAERRREERERRSAEAAEALAQVQAAVSEPDPLFDETGAGTTTFIGSRKTTVLRRRHRSQGADAGDSGTAARAGGASKPEGPSTPAASKLRGAVTACARPFLSKLRGSDGGEAERGDEPDGAPDASADVPCEPTTVLGGASGSDVHATSQAACDDEPGACAPAPLDAPAGMAVADVPATKAPDATAVAPEPVCAPQRDDAPRAERADLPEAPAQAVRPGDSDESYELPPLSILRSNPNHRRSFADDAELAATAQKLQGTLQEFGLTSRVEGWIAGPSVTTFKISMGEGERVSKIVNLEDDIALSLAAKSVRIFAPIPGTSLVGIEIPNEKPQPVYLSDVLPHAKGGPLECAFGRDSEGAPIVVDLAGLPHLLVAGTTGSGKSVLLNAIIMSILMRATPEQVRLIMVDPKRVEFTGYAGLPHLYVPVVTEPRQAASALQWGVTEMERRLKVFEHYKVRDIKTFNGNVEGGKYADMENPPKHMPYFVIVIDELADLMMVAGKDVESSIVRIAQLGRAAGIHLIVATQRPSADVVTGLIRANIDNRVALSVDNALNSRIILDQKGAEQLLGRGDMLVKLRGKKPRRAQGCWVSDEEIEQAVQFICGQVTADYHEDILTAVVPNSPGSGEPGAPKDDDPLVWEAASIVVDSQLGSTSGLQRALSVGYARAGRIMDMLEAKGVVGPAHGSKPRDVLLDREGLEDLRAAEEDFKEVL